MNDFSKGLGARIKAKRELLGMNQKDLANKVGVQPPSIAMYESGRRTPSLDVLFKLATELGTTTDNLLGATDKQGVIVSEEVTEAFEKFALLSPRDRKVIIAVIRALEQVPA